MEDGGELDVGLDGFLELLFEVLFLEEEDSSGVGVGREGVRTRCICLPIHNELVLLLLARTRLNSCSLIMLQDRVKVLLGLVWELWHRRRSHLLSRPMNYVLHKILSILFSDLQPLSSVAWLDQYRIRHTRVPLLVSRRRCRLLHDHALEAVHAYGGGEAHICRRNFDGRGAQLLAHAQIVELFLV